jgi:hypothetical protein
MNTKRRVQKRKQSRKQKRRQNIGGFWPFDKNPEQQTQQQQQQLQKNKDLYLFSSDKISIQSIPSDYKQVGIIHITDSAGINVLRQIGTDWANTFGSKGFDNAIYDELRNRVLTKLQNMIPPNNKVFNVRVDVESGGPTSATIFVHLYGDLCEPTSSRRMQPDEPIRQEPIPVAPEGIKLDQIKLDQV